jgi:MFS-type transporter involved in bile tolerance (Atg22 family)
MLGFAREPDWFGRVFGAFALIAAFSLAPQLVAWSNPHTSADVICYMYAVSVLLLAGMVKYLFLHENVRGAHSVKSK